MEVKSKNRQQEGENEHLEKRRRNYAPGEGRNRWEEWMSVWEEREEKKVEVKREPERWVGVWWGYDELKMTLSGSLVSKDHSVC